MQSLMQLMLVIVIVAILSSIVAVFFVLRGFDKYKEWQNGNKNERWICLSLWVGAAGAIFIGLALILFLVRNEKPHEIILLNYGFPVAICLGLAAIVLSTIYYIFKLRAPK